MVKPRQRSGYAEAMRALKPCEWSTEASPIASPRPFQKGTDWTLQIILLFSRRIKIPIASVHVILLSCRRRSARAWRD
jgi:hypothetical protein